MLRSDIASVMKAIPARIFAENIDPTQSSPTGFSGWGEWMIDTGGLDRGRWSASGDELKVVVQAASGNGAASTCGGTGFIKIDKATGNLQFDPTQLSAASGNSGNAGKTLCEGLKNSYPSGSNRVIPLATTGAVKF